jgi:hypothetical protein
MTRKFKTARVAPALSGHYWKKASEFRNSMNRALAERQPNAAGLNAIHCAISAADAVCVHLSGKRSSSKEHGDAVRLLAELFPQGEGRRQADRLGAVLAKKNEVEYEERLFSYEEAARLAMQAERLYEWVRDQMGL